MAGKIELRPERPGILNEPDLIEECRDAVYASQRAFTQEWDRQRCAVLATLSVLRKRGLLTEQGLALIHANDKGEE